MAFQTGTVASWLDLLDELLGFVSTNQYTENLDTGDGATLIFTGMTLANTPIAVGQSYLIFTVGGIVQYAWEVSGEYISDYIASSSIDRATGAIAFTFSVAPDNTTGIDIVYSTGAEGQDWLTMLSQPAEDSSLLLAHASSPNKEVILKNSGISGLDFVGIGYREIHQSSTNFFGWNQNIYKHITPTHVSTGNWNNNKTETGCTSYDGAKEAWSNMPSLLMASTSLAYFFFSNKRRIIVAVRSSGSLYLGSYLGGYIRLGAPSLHPYPLINIGSVGSSASNITSSNNRFFAKISSDGSFPKRLVGVDNSGLFLDLSGMRISPSTAFSNSGQLKQTTNSKTILFPCYLFSAASNPAQTYGQLDGVYLSPFQDLQSEDTFEIGQYMAFHDYNQTNYDDYTALEDT